MFQYTIHYQKKKKKFTISVTRQMKHREDIEFIKNMLASAPNFQFRCPEQTALQSWTSHSFPTTKICKLGNVLKH